jgi:hypothetical protein
VPSISACKREEIATPAASSEAELIRFPVDNLSIETSMLLLTLLAAAAAFRALLFIPIDKAIWQNSVLFFPQFT